VGDTGWVVRPGDPEAIAGAIEQAYVEWSLSPDRWQSRREAARKRISETFSLERMVQSYEQVWTEVVKHPYHKLARASFCAHTDGGVT
jgi:glycosyltransferase involved in cell wall biosynthesis